MVMCAFGTLFTVVPFGDLPMQGHRINMNRIGRLFLALLIILQVAPAHAQDQPPQPPLTRMLFVMDASNSMNAFWGNKPKISTARELLLKALEELQDQPDLELALRLYGHQTPIQPGRQDCNDTRLEVPFSASSIPSMRRTLEAVRCVGTTPIARSLERAAADFPERSTKRGDRPVRNVIILITDGIEACDEDPCAVSRALQAKGIVLKPFVIGVGLGDAEKYALQCVGNYFDASTPELFEQVLRVVVTQALNSTTAQISLMTADGRPAETDVAVSLYDQRTGKLLHHLMHTMNDRGLPDTLSIDPIHSYRVVAHTLPPSVRENVSVRPGQHTIIAVDAGTGLLDLRMGSGPMDGHEPACIVRRNGQSGTLNAQPVGSSQRYRVGTYDLEVLTLPRLLIPDVTVAQGISTPIIVPKHGVLNITTPSPGPGAVMQARGDELFHVVDLDPTTTNAQFRLQPGTYRVIYRSQNARRTELTIERTVTIESGRSTTLTF
jgi:Ca-activated chloride channel family protein